MISSPGSSRSAAFDKIRNRTAARLGVSRGGPGGATKVAPGAPVSTTSFATKHRQDLGGEVVEVVLVGVGQVIGEQIAHRGGLFRLPDA